MRAPIHESACNCDVCQTFDGKIKDRLALIEERIEPIIEQLNAELERMNMKYVLGIRPVRNTARCVVYESEGLEVGNEEEDWENLLLMSASIILSSVGRQDFADFMLKTGLLAKMGGMF